MLGENLKALRLAAALMNARAGVADLFARSDLRTALAALASMISRTRKARAGQPSGTPQHTLLTNRLKSLRLARAHVASFATPKSDVRHSCQLPRRIGMK